MTANLSGAGNVAMGEGALRRCKGNHNIAVGYFAGQNISQGSDNIDIGSRGIASETGTIRLGHPPTRKRRLLWPA